MILLWGLPGDGPIAKVYEALSRLGHPTTLLDQRAALAAAADMSVGRDLVAQVRTDNTVLDLSDVTAAYLRPYDPRDLPAVKRAGEGSDTWDRALLLVDLMASWAELSEALIVNRPSAMASNSSKPFQVRLLRDMGFSVPDTLITTDPDAVREFCDRHSQVVYKSISSIRSVVSELTAQQMARIEQVCWCPTQFQERILGTDYRVHVVGDELFVTEIETEAVDYRYAGREGHGVTMREARLPADVADRCREAARAMGLELSGVDLRRTAEGEWYCLEVNPSPAFTFYQSSTGQSIDEAVARLLVTGSSVTRSRRPVDVLGPHRYART